jgi:putative DNA primase/helicase
MTLEQAKKTARWLLSAQTVAAVLNLARSDPRLAATVDQWDADPFILGGNMYCDLRTGQLKQPDPKDYITKITAAPAAPRGTPHPLWSAFLKRVTDDDAALQAYLQRMAGYCLTGSIKEHALFFLYGGGANGKSVFVNTLLGIWNDYALTIGTDMLMVSHSERHPTEIARLRGCRLAVAGEIEIGQTWAEAKIKKLTGGERLQGRYMRQDFFEFAPQFKLMIIGNHKPSLRGVDEAIRRRLHLIPFTVTIPEPERDLDLPDKLKPEWPAILRWAVDGCLEWQRTGLNPPPAVRAATDRYLAAEDSFALWLDACIEPDVNAWESNADLWASWKKWADFSGEYVGKQKSFSQTLAERSFVPERRGHAGTRGFRGGRIIRPDYSDDPRYGD